MCSPHSRQANEEDEDPRGSSSPLHGQFISSESPHLSTLNLEDKQNLLEALNGPDKSCPGCVSWSATYPCCPRSQSQKPQWCLRNLTCSMGCRLGTIELINKHLKSCLFLIIFKAISTKQGLEIKSVMGKVYMFPKLIS